MANSRFYSSTALETTLTTSITPSTTVIQVAATTGFPGSLPYTLALDYGAASMELVEVTGVAALSLTVTRAIDGTSAVSHNAGAAVRHVSSARDFTDSRTHEAAVSAAHGVAGTIVGTTDTQTLTNKTISGGTFSGTIAGSPTFSGTVTHTGATNLNAGGALQGTFSGNPGFSGTPTFNAGASLSGTFTGTPTFGGSVTFNGIATHNNLIQSSQTSSTTNAVATIASGDTFDRFRLNANGDMEWGPGNAARDTTLKRSAANVLKTDDSLEVGGDLRLANGTTIFRNALSVAAGTTVANTTTETVVSTFPIPANDAVAGASYQVKLVANVSFLASAQLTWRARIGGVSGTVITTNGPTTLSGTAQTNKEAVIELTVICLTTGGSGTWFGSMEEARNTTQTGSVGEIQITSSDGGVTRDTTISNDLVITAQWGAASASNTLTARGISQRTA